MSKDDFMVVLVLVTLTFCSIGVGFILGINTNVQSSKKEIASDYRKCVINATKDNVDKCKLILGD